MCIVATAISVIVLALCSYVYAYSMNGQSCKVVCNWNNMVCTIESEDLILNIRIKGLPPHVKVSIYGEQVVIKNLNGKSLSTINISDNVITARVEPTLIRVDIPISGTLSPGYGDMYGPFTGAYAICVTVSWTPTDQDLGVIIFDYVTGEGYLWIFTRGSGFTGCVTVWDWQQPYVVVFSPEYNTKVITYTGTITIYYW